MSVLKTIVRHDGVQRALGRAVAAYLRFCFATTRWTRIGGDHLDIIVNSTDGVLVCFWHNTLLISPALWPHARRPGHVLISQSRDGNAVAYMAEALGLKTIRGSSTKKTAPDKAKGGAQAFRAMFRLLKSGGALAITPDGPRGPAEVVQPGAAQLATATGVQTLCVGIALTPVWRLHSWDRLHIPLPFARGCCVYSAPLPPPEDPEALRTRIEDTLHTATAHAHEGLSCR